MPLMYDKICIGCKAPFKSRRLAAKFCKSSCYLNHQRENKGWFKPNHSLWIGRKRTYENRLKIQESHVKYPRIKTPEMLAKLAAGRKLGHGPHKGQTWTKSIHNEMIAEQSRQLEAQGFRVIPLIRPIPDIIAIKDGKVYSVEVETYGRPDYGKYEGVTYFDDIIWVIGKKPLKP